MVKMLKSLIIVLGSMLWCDIVAGGGSSCLGSRCKRSSSKQKSAVAKKVRRNSSDESPVYVNDQKEDYAPTEGESSEEGVIFRDSTYASSVRMTVISTDPEIIVITYAIPCRLAEQHLCDRYFWSADEEREHVQHAHEYTLKSNLSGKFKKFLGCRLLVGNMIE